MMIIFKFAFILLALRNSSAHAHEVSKINGNRLTAGGENVMSSQKELIAIVTTRMMLKGRKMMTDEDSREKMIEAKKELREHEISKISGYHDTLKRTRSLDRGESQKLFDQAADEILNLMRKDYVKGPMKPRHKPPINNNGPKH